MPACRIRSLCVSHGCFIPGEVAPVASDRRHPYAETYTARTASKRICPPPKPARRRRYRRDRRYGEGARRRHGAPGAAYRDSKRRGRPPRCPRTRQKPRPMSSRKATRFVAFRPSRSSQERGAWLVAVMPAPRAAHVPQATQMDARRRERDNAIPRTSFMPCLLPRRQRKYARLPSPRPVHLRTVIAECRRG